MDLHPKETIIVFIYDVRDFFFKILHPFGISFLIHRLAGMGGPMWLFHSLSQRLFCR